MSQPQQPAQEQVGGFLGFIERAGNRIPDITMLFIAAFLLRASYPRSCPSSILVISILRQGKKSWSQTCLPQRALLP